MHLRTNRLFIESAARDFKRTGAVAPSSRCLASAMTRELAAARSRPVAVLEVGGGTGSITAEIVRHLMPDDTLDVYEIDRLLARVLRARIRLNGAGNGHGGIRVVNEAIESIEPVPRYDFVISGLPFTNFQPENVRQVFEIFRSVLKPGGSCSFYEYILVRRAARIMSSTTAARQRVEGVGHVVREYVRRYEFRHQIVLRNLPPALVHTIRFHD